MIEDLWTSLRTALIIQGGYPRLIEFLKFALAVAELEQSKMEERGEMRASLD